MHCRTPWPRHAVRLLEVRAKDHNEPGLAAPMTASRVVPALFDGEEVHEVTVVGVEVLDYHRGVWDLDCSHLVIGSVRSPLIWDARCSVGLSTCCYEPEMHPLPALVGRSACYRPIAESPCIPQRHETRITSRNAVRAPRSFVRSWLRAKNRWRASWRRPLMRHKRLAKGSRRSGSRHSTTQRWEFGRPAPRTPSHSTNYRPGPLGSHTEPEGR